MYGNRVLIDRRKLSPGFPSHKPFFLAVNYTHTWTWTFETNDPHGLGVFENAWWIAENQEYSFNFLNYKKYWTLLEIITPGSNDIRSHDVIYSYGKKSPQFYLSFADRRPSDVWLLNVSVSYQISLKQVDLWDNKESSDLRSYLNRSLDDMIKLNFAIDLDDNGIFFMIGTPPPLYRYSHFEKAPSGVHILNLDESPNSLTHTITNFDTIR